MRKTSIAAFVLSVLAAVMSAAALAVGIVALIKSCGSRRMAAAEYNYYSRRSDDEDDEEENIGSDTLAF